VLLFKNIKYYYYYNLLVAMTESYVSTDFSYEPQKMGVRNFIRTPT